MTVPDVSEALSALAAQLEKLSGRLESSQAETKAELARLADRIAPDPAPRPRLNSDASERDRPGASPTAMARSVSPSRSGAPDGNGLYPWASWDTLVLTY